jgi:hypothetical protein
MSIESMPLTAAEIVDEIGRLRGMAERALGYGEHSAGVNILWMVLDSAAESISDGLDLHQEMSTDVD